MQIGNITSDADATRRFHCTYYTKSFKRSEHHQRHLRGHTQEKPFQCRYCARCYSRKYVGSALSDLVTRHIKTLHAAEHDGQALAAGNAASRLNAAAPATAGAAAGDEHAPPALPSSTEPLTHLSTIPGSVPIGNLGPDLDVFGSLDFFDLSFNAWTHDSALNGLDVSPLMNSSSPNNIPITVMASSHCESSPAVPKPAAIPLPYCLPGTSFPGEESTQASSLPELPDQVFLRALQLRSAIPSSQHAHYPTVDALRASVHMYLRAFDVHLPLFHLPSFQAAVEVPQQLFAVAAIGALYRLERHTAAFCYLSAELIAEREDLTPGTHETEHHRITDLLEPQRLRSGSAILSLPQARTQLLLSFFALLHSSDCDNGEMMRRIASQYATYQSLAHTLVSDLRRPEQDMAYHEWVAHESSKRTLHGTWVLFSMLKVTHGIPSLLSVSRDGQHDLPCGRSLWTAPDEASWRRAMRNAPTQTNMSMQDALSVLATIDGSQKDLAIVTGWSRFAVVLMMHVATLQTSQVLESATAWQSESELWTSTTGSFTAALAQILTTLSKCRGLVVGPGTPRSDPCMDPSETVPFNAAAVLRFCYGRVLPLAEQRSSLLQCDDELLVVSLRDFINAQHVRDETISQIVTWVFEGLCLPVRRGVQLVRKTAALTWSVEHGVAAWDAALVVTKWLHTVERARASGHPLSQDELDLLEHITKFFERVEGQVTPPKSVASHAARFLASFYEDTWVWGVTARMGKALQTLADIVETAM
ncbi:hypothetical protein CKM354_001215600 [Cercospora kikuchii]|uniref:C2H2-type domain-containing protein n=1 Tax=Cercospora kikuchii TaxID=84275 RepID=A0A9P3FLF9_9PEZI|nr:uncharacterized protein CKM354_001215600 [Cercospora kikuchii]GIZ49117.1 hypothetical protein CKM354_001215600 [Cercospora kikuchii]